MSKQKLSLSHFVNTFRQGDAQRYQNLMLIPLFFDQKPLTRYISLNKALKKGWLEITEKSTGGSVPELIVNNKSNKRILLLDSEELAGAKQNRILNTTILIKKHANLIIPVSCTEAGRWNYSSRTFRDSGNIATPEVRFNKIISVTKSLEHNKSYRSDQAKVWNDVDQIIEKLKVKSNTRAMKDAYDAKESDLRLYRKAFHVLKKQKGMLVIINNEIVAMEYLSSSRAFKKLFDKWLKSYAMQAMLNKQNPEKGFETAALNDFLQKLSGVQSSHFKSPGLGHDFRFSDNDISGNTLVYRNEVIHLTAFANKFSSADNTLHRINRIIL